MTKLLKRATIDPSMTPTLPEIVKTIFPKIRSKPYPVCKIPEAAGFPAAIIRK
jgi:hypothetical protein